MLSRIKLYIDAYYQTLNIAPIKKYDIKVLVLDGFDFENKANQLMENEGINTTDMPMFWYFDEDKENIYIVIKDDIFLEDNDERFGLECLYSQLTEITGTFNGELVYPFFDIVKKAASFSEAAFEYWKEFYCTFMATLCIKEMFEDVGKEGYDTETIRDNAIDLLLKTVEDTELDVNVKMSTLLYLFGKMAATERNLYRITNLRPLLEGSGIEDTVQELYGALTRMEPQSKNLFALKSIFNGYEKLKKAFEAGNVLTDKLLKSEPDGGESFEED